MYRLLLGILVGVIFVFGIVDSLPQQKQWPIMATENRRPLLPGDLAHWDRFSEFSVSPFLQETVYSRWHYSDAVNGTSMISKHLEMVVRQSDQAIQITQPEPGQTDSEPTWISTKHLVFLRKNKKVSEFPQLMVAERFNIDSTQWTVRSLTQAPLDFEVAHLRYVSATKQLAFATQVYATEQSSIEETRKMDQEKKARDQDSTVLVFDKAYVRHWDQFDNHKNSHVFTVPLDLEHEHFVDFQLAVNWMRGLKSLSTPMLPFGDRAHFQFSPDGRYLIFASMKQFDQSEQAWSSETHIYHIREALVEQLNCITCEQGAGAKSLPSFSPDGSMIAWTQMNRAQFEADKSRLMVMKFHEPSSVRELTIDLDASVQAYQWSSTNIIYFYVEQVGRTQLYSIRSDGTELTKRGEPLGGMSFLAVIPGADTVVVAASTMQRPTELFVLQPTNTFDRVSNFHGVSLSNVDMSVPEVFWFEGAKQEKVMGWLLRPFNFDPSKKYPVAFLIHGGPQSAWTDSFSTRWNPQLFTGAGFVTVMVNFHGSTGYGQKFVDSISGDWGGAPFDDLMLGLDHVISSYPFVDSSRIAGLGASYGGYMINWINGHSDRFRCLVNHDGLFDVKSMYYTTEELYFPEYDFGGVPFKNPELYDKWNPSNHVGKWSTPTLVIHGGRDYRVPEGEGFATFTALQRQKIPSRLLYFPDENHWILKPANIKRWYAEVLSWISQWTA